MANGRVASRPLRILVAEQAPQDPGQEQGPPGSYGETAIAGCRAEAGAMAVSPYRPLRTLLLLPDACLARRGTMLHRDAFAARATQPRRLSRSRRTEERLATRAPLDGDAHRAIDARDKSDEPLE